MVKMYLNTLDSFTKIFVITFTAKTMKRVHAKWFFCPEDLSNWERLKALGIFGVG